MKSYTDLEQSKKLAEILPHESADMNYSTWTTLDGELIVSPNQGSTIESLRENYGNQIMPCWSLAALLNYLRESDFFPNIEVNEHSMTMNVSYYDEKEARPLAPIHNIKVEADTFVDACYELIMKLNEFNLL